MPLTAEDRELLSRDLFAMITVAPAADRFPAPRPVWFELTDAGVQIFSFASTQRVSRVREVPRASVVVATPPGEPERWVSIEGPASVHTDGAFDLAARMAERYYSDTPENLAVLEEWREAELVRIVVEAERVNRFGV